VNALYTVPVPRARDTYFLVRFSHGYGESLIDYDRSITRVGVGVAFSR
jgi:phospholipase A1